MSFTKFCVPYSTSVAVLHFQDDGAVHTRAGHGAALGRPALHLAQVKAVVPADAVLALGAAACVAGTEGYLHAVQNFAGGLFFGGILFLY